MDKVPNTPSTIGSTGQPVTERRTAVAALRPATAMDNLAAMLGRIPREPLGLPITTWIGGALMLGVLLLLFVV